MLKRITRKLAILAVLAGMLSGLAPSMLAVRTAHADEASQSRASTTLDRSSAPAPKRSEAAKPEPLTAADVQVRSAVVPSDALASGTAGTCLFYVTSDMRLTVTPADGTSGTLPTGANASDWPWYRYAAYIRSVSFDPGVKTSSTLSHAFASASTTDPEYNQLKSIDLANLDMADLRSVYTAFANDTRLRSVSFKGALNADGITDWTSVFLQSGIESIDLSDVGDAATTVHGLFQGCRSLKTAVIPWAMAHVADASAMFAYDTSLSTLDTTAWRFGAVWNMSDMFNGCKNLAVLDASDWDISNTTNMGHMFYGCSSLASLDSSGWHVAKAKYVDHMFDGCSSLTAVDVSGWNMSNVSLASYMFYNCAKLATLDTSAWSMPNATDVSYMFYSCRSLATLDVGKLDLGRSVDLQHMFENCISLTTLDVSKWNTGRVQRTESMFTNCGKLATLDVSHWDTGMVGNMNNMFSGCGSLAALDVAGWNTGGVGDFQSMFNGCGSLTTLDVSKWNTGNARYMNGMFTNCARLAALDVAGWDTSKVTSFDSMFNGCGSLTTLDVSEWDTGRSTRFCYMFDNCVKLARLDVSKWDTGRATILAGMFHKCVRLTTLDVAGWDVSNATNISQMFDTCTDLASLDVSKWNVDKVRHADWLFSGCVNLKTIDVSKWTLHGLGRLYGMFSGCRSVGTLDLSGWDTTGVTSVRNLFHHCVNLTRIYVGDGWDMGRVTEDDLLFDGDVLLVGDDGKGLAYDSSKKRQGVRQAERRLPHFENGWRRHPPCRLQGLDGQNHHRHTRQGRSQGHGARSVGDHMAHRPGHDVQCGQLAGSVHEGWQTPDRPRRLRGQLHDETGAGRRDGAHRRGRRLHRGQGRWLHRMELYRVLDGQQELGRLLVHRRNGMLRLLLQHVRSHGHHPTIHPDQRMVRFRSGRRPPPAIDPGGSGHAQRHRP